MLSDNVIKAFAEKFTNTVSAIELLGQSHNTVYRINSPSPFVLRVTPDNHRSRNELLSELDFISYLYKNGAEVSRPIPSLTGEYVADYQTDNEFGHLSAFTIAEGLDWRSRENDDGIVLEQIGRTLGKIHKISRSYCAENVSKRRQYYESQHLTKAVDLFGKSNPSLNTCLRDYLAQISKLPKTNVNYGLTHGDYLFSNYNITQSNKVTVFDFDECEYSWYINDIAICLYYYLLGGDPTELNTKVNEAERNLIALMTGYLSENDLPLDELVNINMFFAMRDFILLSTLYEHESLGKWKSDFIRGASDRIINRKPFIDLNIHSVVEKLKAKQKLI
jgi:Ser/Thr protein kinase RdoA (MazF antagonist)